MNSTREQEIQACIQLLNTVYQHVGTSFAEVVTGLHAIQHEAECTERHSDIETMNSYLLSTIAKHYIEIAEVSFQQVLAFLKNEAVQGRLPFEDNPIPF